MGIFDFDEMTDRRHTGSLKWDISDDDGVIPLWVADMDFRTAPVVTDALLNRVAQGIFGYVEVPEKYYKALIEWFSRRHGWTIRRDSVIYTSGVVPAISAIIKALTIPGDGVIVQTPAYNCFFSSIRNNGCRLASNPLVQVREENGLSFKLDIDGLEKLAADPRNRLLILCNPHNPTGRVWTREELEVVRDICHRHEVTVVSDEIHCELTHPGYSYVPYATIDEKAIVCSSPSKAFNTAGLQIANIICPDIRMRSRIDRAINDNEVCDVNPFGVEGLVAAYEYGEEWLEALRNYLYGNYRMLRDEFAVDLPRLEICNSESTYLAWIDISKLGMSGDDVERYLLEKAKVRVSSGSIYGADRFIRINYACPSRRLSEAMSRIVKVLKDK